ncbi:hypothetical protein CRYUN_Cryun41cG0044900 [Craigia yunnanensis]
MFLERVRAKGTELGGASAVDWRSSLFSIFLGNLSTRVSRSALWEVFLQYGMVVDVYISYATNRHLKDGTFAFVRYKRESEMWRAIEDGNNRRVESSLRIPSSVFVNIRGSLFRILVEVEETLGSIFKSSVNVEGCYSSDDDEPSRNLHEKTSNLQKSSNLYVEVVDFHELDLGSRYLANDNFTNLGYGSLLTEIEL